MGKPHRPNAAPTRDSRQMDLFFEFDEAERAVAEEESDNGNEGDGDAQ
jgi:hypothetical protein